LEAVDTKAKPMLGDNTENPEEPSTGAKDVDSLATLNNSEQSKGSLKLR